MLTPTEWRTLHALQHFEAAPHRVHQHADGTEEWMAFFKDPEGRLLAIMAQTSR